jgi:hypothetical protein
MNRLIHFPPRPLRKARAISQKIHRKNVLPDALRDRMDRKGLDKKPAGKNSHVAWTEIGDFILIIFSSRHRLRRACPSVALELRGSNGFYSFTVTPNPLFLPKTARCYHCHSTNITKGRDHVGYVTDVIWRFLP